MGEARQAVPKSGRKKSTRPDKSGSRICGRNPSRSPRRLGGLPPRSRHTDWSRYHQRTSGVWAWYGQMIGPWSGTCP